MLTYYNTCNTLTVYSRPYSSDEASLHAYCGAQRGARSVHHSQHLVQDSLSNRVFRIIPVRLFWSHSYNAKSLARVDGRREVRGKYILIYSARVSWTISQYG